jgi:SNF family Na+-dependent transporter
MSETSKVETSDTQTVARGAWGSKLGFVLAAAGSAVGLGNIWKFPYITGENGGGIFVLIYLFCILLIGLPIMIAEIMLGRGTQRSPVGAFGKLSGPGSKWQFVGWLGILAGFIILSYYSVVAGWTLNYTLMSFCDFYHVEKHLSFTVSDPSAAVFESKHVQAQGKAAVYLTDATGYSRLLKRNRDYSEALMKPDENNPQGRIVFTMNESCRIQGNNVVDIKYRIPQDGEVLKGIFDKVYTSPGINIFWHTIFMVFCMVIVSKGVSKGIEEWSRLLMPVLFVILGVLFVKSMFSGGFGKAWDFLFGFDFSRLKPSGVLEALGHAFFTLSLGMGALLTYGSYLKRDADLTVSAIQISILDTLVALMACLVIFPIVFAYNFPAQGGPGLVFKTMPVIFSQMEGGTFFGVLFFLLLAFAALTSAISLLEVVVSYCVDEVGMKRFKATMAMGGLTYVLGLFSALAGSGTLLPDWLSVYGRNFFDTMDFFASNWLLPFGGLLIAVYMGWFAPADWREKEFKEGSRFASMYGIWLFFIRFVAPAGVLIVFLQKIGFIDVDRLLG